LTGQLKDNIIKQYGKRKIISSTRSRPRFAGAALPF